MVMGFGGVEFPLLRPDSFRQHSIYDERGLSRFVGAEAPREVFTQINLQNTDIAFG